MLTQSPASEKVKRPPASMPGASSYSILSMANRAQRVTSLAQSSAVTSNWLDWTLPARAHLTRPRKLAPADGVPPGASAL